MQGGRHLDTLKSVSNTDLPGYSDTGYRDILFTVTLLAVPLFLKCVTVSRYLLKVTLLAGPEGVTVSGEICSQIPMTQNVKEESPSSVHYILINCTELSPINRYVSNVAKFLTF